MIGESIAARPWMRAGLKYLLTESGERVRELSAEEPLEGRTEKGESAEHAVKNGSPENTYAKKRAIPPAAARNVRGHTAADVPGRQEKIPSSAKRPFDSWGADWRNLWARLNMGDHPRIVWTYAGLGEDLAGAASAERRTVMAHILKGLGHPRGTHAFWPYMLPGAGPEPEVFWSALDMAGSRAVLVFGSEARDALLLPRTLKPYCQEIYRGRMVIQLQRPESLFSDEAGLRKLILFLGPLLGRCLPVQG